MYKIGLNKNKGLSCYFPRTGGTRGTLGTEPKLAPRIETIRTTTAWIGTIAIFLYLLKNPSTKSATEGTETKEQDQII